MARDERKRILFVGDVVGAAAVDLLERHLPALITAHGTDLVVVNGENADVTGPRPATGCGLTPASAGRLFAAGADVITGGNHSWDGPLAADTLALPRVLRPDNYGPHAPGTGHAVVAKDGVRFGVVNLASRSALPAADHPYGALEARLEAWGDAVDVVLVDFHGESVSEKAIFAYAFDGRVAAVLGTHTHVPTDDARVLPRGTAYVTDVGMTGPSASMQGYEPDVFVAAYRDRLPIAGPARVAAGPLALGAVLVTVHGSTAVAIERLATPMEEAHA
jgi:metallophosphoesterase (TIGR00282 family)